MRLDEYSKPRVPVKVFKVVDDEVRTSSSSLNMDQKLEKLGWEFFNGGSFAAVYTNPKKPYILKINKQPDKAYAYYVSIIRKLHNKHFPKISDLKFIEVNGGRYYIYLIEKLHKAKYGVAIASRLDFIMNNYEIPLKK